MDTEVLIDAKVRDGQRLLSRLARDQFEVVAAFWMRPDEGGAWNLWIATPLAEPTTRRDALDRVLAALDAVPDCAVSTAEVGLIHPSNSAVRVAVAERDRNPGQGLVRYFRKELGRSGVGEVYVYQRPLPLAVREGDSGWEVLISEPDVWLSCETEADARAIAAARVLEHDALAGRRTGRPFADELERTADVLEKYRMNFGSRFLRRRAQAVR